MTNVFYAPKMEGWNDSYDHPLFEDEVFLGIQPYLSYYKDRHSKHVYYDCPAWKNYYKNCFVIFSQVDIDIRYDKKTGLIDRNSYQYCTFDEGNPEGTIFDVPAEFRNTEIRPYSNLIIGQIKQHYVFWSSEKKKNLWIEIFSPPETIEKNMEIITAEYPFNKWKRPMLCAYKFNSENTFIKRGEPIGIVRIKNLDNYTESISLKRLYPPKEIQRKSLNHSLMKMFLPNRSWEIMNKETSKCPFKKFWS